MHIMQGVHSFQFNYELSLDQQIQATSADGYALIVDGYWLLIQELDTPPFQGDA